MKLLLSLIILALGSSSVSAAVAVTMKQQGSTRDVMIRDVTVSSEQSKLTRRVYVVNYTLKNPKKFIWIFHGYKPAGDPYQQSAEQFIQNWNLASFCRSNGYVCIIADMGTSMYAVSELNNSEKVSDMRFLKEIYNELIFKSYKDASLVLAGVSTGVEGAVKLASLVQNVESVIGISGTYDFFSIAKDNGEYKIHERVFGTDQSVWLKENPLDILKHSVRMRLYVFSESQSMYNAQAKILLDTKMSNIEAVNLLPLGKGYSHNWNFWGSGKLVKELHKIMAAP